MAPHYLKGAKSAALAALLALTVSIQAEERIFWISIGDGLTNASTLDTLIDAAEAQNYNAVSILARYRADALYIPNRDSSTYTNNEPRRTTSIDTVQHVIDRAKSKGMRVYAAWSVFLVTDGSNTYPAHIPGGTEMWVYQDTIGSDNSIYNPDGGFPQIATTAFTSSGRWMDPGVQASRDYNKEVLLDFVENYDVDGIILDRIRYPGEDFPVRQKSFGYNPTALTEMGLTNPAPSSTAFRDARRDAVTSFITDTRADVHALKPWIIFSATPVVFGSNLSDTYNSVFQYFPDWNSAVNSDHVSGFGALDAIMPQYYRTNTTTNTSLIDLAKPDVTNIAHLPLFQNFLEAEAVAGAKYAINICDTRDPGRNTLGHGIFAGTAAIETDFTNALAAENTSCGTDVMGAASPLVEYTIKTGWDSTPPSTIADLTIDDSVVRDLTLNWSSATDAVSYQVYRSTSPSVDLYYENLLTTVTATTFTDEDLSDSTYYYKVVAVDGYNNKAASNEANGSPLFVDVIVESRDNIGTITSSPDYVESGGFSNTSAKSTAPGVVGSGSRFGTTVSQTATFAPEITICGNYDVYVTLQAGGGNSNANANANWSATTTEGSNEAGSVHLLYSDSNLGNNWLKLNTAPLSFAAGNAGTVGSITFTNLDGNASSGARFNMDAVRFSLVEELPCPTSETNWMLLD